MFQKCCKFLSIPMAVVLFISTTGIALFEHHCNTNGTSSFAVFSPIECSHHCSHHGDCNQCCSSQSENNCSIPQKETSDCCNDIFHFLKVDIQATYSVVSVHKIQPLAIDIFQSVLPLSKYNFSSENDMKGCAYTPKPPPKTGSFIVILFSSLKIPEFSA
jgi:hypothetical protein